MHNVLGETLLITGFVFAMMLRVEFINLDECRRRPAPTAPRRTGNPGRGGGCGGGAGLSRLVCGGDPVRARRAAVRRTCRQHDRHQRRGGVCHAGAVSWEGRGSVRGAAGVGRGGGVGGATPGTPACERRRRMPGRLRPAPGEGSCAEAQHPAPRAGLAAAGDAAHLARPVRAGGGRRGLQATVVELGSHLVAGGDGPGPGRGVDRLRALSGGASLAARGTHPRSQGVRVGAGDAGRAGAGPPGGDRRLRLRGGAATHGDRPGGPARAHPPAGPAHGLRDPVRAGGRAAFRAAHLVGGAGTGTEHSRGWRSRGASSSRSRR